MRSFSHLLRASVVALLAVPALVSSPACAATVQYTFQGNGNGTYGGIAIGPTSFTITLSQDTSAIHSLGGGVYEYQGVNADITSPALNGTGILTGVSLLTNGNGTVELLDAGGVNGFGITNSAALSGYALATSVDTGVVSGANLLVTSTAPLFQILNGPVLGLTQLTSLEFSSVAPATPPAATPEPSTLLLLSSGLPGLALLRRRFAA